MNEVFGFKTWVKSVVVMMLRQGGIFFDTVYSCDRFLATGRVQWPAKTGRRIVVFACRLKIQKKNG